MSEVKNMWSVDNMRLCVVGEVGFYHSTALSKNMHD